MKSEASQYVTEDRGHYGNVWIQKDIYSQTNGESPLNNPLLANKHAVQRQIPQPPTL